MKNIGIEPWLVGGASLYWAAIVVQFLSSWESVGYGAVAPGVRYGLLALYVGLGFAAPRVFTTVLGRTVLAAVLAASGVAVVALRGWADPVAQGVCVAVRLFTVAGLMVLWGFAFASMDKRRAGQNVAVTIVLAAFGVLVATLLVPSGAYATVSGCALAVSAATLVLGRVRFANRKRERTDAYAEAMRSFVLSRVVFGCAMGLGLTLLVWTESAAVHGSLALVGMGFLVAVLGMYGRHAEALYLALPSLLCIVEGAVFLPFFDDGVAGVAQTATGLMWLAWASFSAFQLSDLKERCGLEELTLCLVEKTVLSLAIALGCGTGSAVRFLTGAPDGRGDCLLVFAMVGAVVLATSWAMGRLVSARKDDELQDELARSRRARAEQVYDAIALEYGLSAREREVVGMLAEGYTRTFIRESLGISDGTAKSHISHIYQKLDIHRKDDLLEFIDERMANGAAS